MAEFTMPKHGEICWRELNTQNSDAAREFYQGMFGWTLEQSKVTEIDYKEIHFDGKAVGGIMPITDCWGENWQKIPSSWMNYIAVENADETVAKIKENGGGVCIAPFDAPGVGRMSVVNDPAGATFSIIQFISE